MARRRGRACAVAGTPIRRALKGSSSLQPLVRDGIAALETKHRCLVSEEVRDVFGDSLDLDEAMRSGRDQDPRWDYLLGHTPRGEVVGLEPHSAKEDQISRVIAKRAAAHSQLRDHMRPGQHISRWFWVASGSVQFPDTGRARRRLDDAGITFVGRALKAKDLA